MAIQKLLFFAYFLENRKKQISNRIIYNYSFTLISVFLYKYFTQVIQ